MTDHEEAVEATMMVQKDPPEDLLDLLSHLGYTFQQLEKDGEFVTSLKGTKQLDYLMCR